MDLGASDRTLQSDAGGRTDYAPDEKTIDTVQSHPVGVRQDHRPIPAHLGLRYL
jgi:hypothetical protein